MRKIIIFIVLICIFVSSSVLTLDKQENYSDDHIKVVKQKEPQSAILRNSYLMLVNKNYFVEKEYRPLNLVNPRLHGARIANDDVLVPKEVLNYYLKMVDDLKLYDLHIFSGYRSYEKQEILYNYYQDDNYSARPGYSEHHTGFALDLSTLDSGLEIFFSKTEEYKLLINNCYKYGFILRYPAELSQETGYLYEPWHFRYVGPIHAFNIYQKNISLENYIFQNFDF
jgi:D-alanyl-D-alanine carboxypeptidase